MPKKDFTQDVRTIINIVGKVVCDPAVAAAGNDLLLISDDFGFRIWSAEMFGIPTTWLQPVLMTALQDGHITANQYYEAVNTLTLGGHTFTSLDSNCLMHQARKDHFEVTHGMSSLLDMVGGPLADIYTNSLVMAAFIEEVLKECSDEMKMKRIVSEAFSSFTKGRQENLRQLIGLILMKMGKRNRHEIIEHALGWVVGHSFGMPYHNELLQMYNKLMSRYFRATF